MFILSHFGSSLVIVACGSSFVTMSDDDGVRCAPGPQGRGADDDLPDDSGADEGAAARVAVPRRRNRRPPRSGVFPCFLVADSTRPGPRHFRVEDFVRFEASKALPVSVVGLARCEWRLAEASDQTRADYAELGLPRAQWGRAQKPWAYIEYRALERWSLSEMVPLPEGFDAGGTDAEMCIRRRIGDIDLPTAGAVVKKFLVRKFPGVALHVVSVHPWYFRDADSLPAPFHSVQLGLRNTFVGLVPGRPAISFVKRWRNELGVRSEARVLAPEEDEVSPWAKVALELPVSRARIAQVDVGRRCRRFVKRKVDEEDPLQLILGLDFATCLRNKAEFSQALAAAHAYEHGWDAPPRGSQRTTITDERGRDLPKCSMLSG